MNQTITLTQDEALAAGTAIGGIFGGMLAVVIILSLAVYVLMIIANWKIFTKAGEAGWKSIIPIYNLYVLCKIIDVNFWIFMLGIPLGLGILSAVVPVLSIASGIYALFLLIYTAIKLGDAFGKSAGFKVGLVLLPNIFELILAFGDSKYVAKKSAKKD